MLNKTVHPLILLITILSIYACNTRKANEWNYREYYDLNKPDAVDSLSAELLEISGLAYISDKELGCVQDEQGIIFLYDLQTKENQQQIIFGPDGDYEGITLANSTWFVLRSDGLLYELKAFREKPEVKTHTLDLPTHNHEGLCFDRTTNSLYIVAKSPLEKDRVNEDIRLIYTFDLVERKLNSKPLLMHISHIQEFAFHHNLPVAQKPNKKGISKKVALQFKPSAIAVHPVTQDIFILSASDPILLIIDKEGTIKDYFSLDPDLFNKPEGITFTESGDMMIANEGKKGKKKPTLMVFKWHSSE